MDQPSVLVVDDEVSVRITVGEILRHHGFKVAVAGTVPEALSAIISEKFDALISDLNIGELSDGFTLVSAMRRQQPCAVTVLMTGFPAFERALQGIRNQVDEYIVKPMQPGTLVSLLQDRLAQPKKASECSSRVFKRASEVIRENLVAIVEEWLKSVRASEELKLLDLPHDQLSGPMLSRLSELAGLLECAQSRHEQQSHCEAAFQLGLIRSQQGYRPVMLVEEARLLQESIFLCLGKNLLSFDSSQLVFDMVSITDRSLLQLESTLKGASVLHHFQMA